MLTSHIFLLAEVGFVLNIVFLYLTNSVNGSILLESIVKGRFFGSETGIYLGQEMKFHISYIVTNS
jgi:hypothetical protein